MQNFINRVDMLILFVRVNFKWIFICSGVVSILLALISKFTFEPNIEEGIKFHQWVSYYSAQLSVVALVIPFAGGVLLLLNKE